MKNYVYKLNSGIKPSPKFQRRGWRNLPSTSACGAATTAPIAPAGRCFAATRLHKTLGTDAFATGYSIVDPDIAEKVATDAKRKQKRGMVQLCTTVDAWAPEGAGT